MTLERARQLDATDPLRFARERFALPEGMIYLDGNSLGALPKATPHHLADVVERQWGQDLINSWNRHGWIEWPMRIAAKLAPIVGARPSELLIADSTTVNLFKLLAAAMKARPDRRVILTEEGNFPTDAYAAEAVASLMPGIRVDTRPKNELLDVLDAEVGVLFLTHVNYRTGARHDMVELNRAAHDAGALTLWDLSHTAGALAVDLNASEADLAVGCGYKYLNGGPGAPAFLFVADHLQPVLESPIPGWMGDRNPFAFAHLHTPADGIRRFLTGTPSILALAALDAGLDTFDGVRIADVERKAESLTDFFLESVQALCGSQLMLPAPCPFSDRGSHVSVGHPEGYAVMQALIAEGIIGDFRPPDLMRFGFAPLYNSHLDAWSAATALSQILATRAWDKGHFRQRQTVT
ncbi:kynureninase [Sphingomonas daechungensis]|uniref:kynureninase n=1 Tax=Sphingomonas daechungensis TaxID=1176646 RepID=UPI0031EB82BA